MKITPKYEKIKEGGEERPDPCLYSNNSIENPENTSKSPSSPTLNLLTQHHKKQAQTLFENVERLVKKEAISINHVAFLTLTFEDNVTDPKEAYRRFRSFNTNFLSKHEIYGEWVNTKEHQKRGAWHFHMIITLTQDIRTGFDFDLYDKWLKGPRKAGTFPTGSKELHQLWAEMGEALAKYKFGKIFTLEPIKSNEEALARYVGKYISKHIGEREECDKGVRLVNYSKNWLKNSVKRAWNTDNSKLWREKLNVFAKYCGCSDFYQLSEKLGAGWAYKYQDAIVGVTAEELYNERVQPVADKEYESKFIKKLKENREQTFEDQKSPFPTDRRRKERKLQKEKNYVEAVKTGMKEYYGDDFAELLAHEAELELGERALRSAHKHKSYVHDRESLGIPLNTQPIEVPF